MLAIPQTAQQTLARLGRELCGQGEAVVLEWRRQMVLQVCQW